VVVPPNTTAKVTVVANTEKELGLNGKTFEDNNQVKLIDTNAAGFELLVQPGDYKFTSTL